MVGTRDRVPLGIGLSSEISAGLMPAGAPHAFLSVFLGIRFSRFPGRLIRPAPPLPSVRGARRYITRTPSRGQGAFSPFSREGAPYGPFSPYDLGRRALMPFVPRTYFLHKPRKGAGRRYGASRCARAGTHQMFPSPTNQASPVPGRFGQLSGRIISSEIRRRGRRVTIYSSVMPRRGFPAS